MTAEQPVEALRQHNQELARQVAELEAQLQRQSYGALARLNMILELTAALLMTRDVDPVLNAVARQAQSLVPGTVLTLIYLADADGRLVLRRSDREPLPALVQAPLQGVAGRAFAAPRAMLMAGPELASALAEHDAAQAAQLQALLGEHYPPLCALTAPLRLDEACLGVLVLFGGRQAHLFHPRDLKFAEALAHVISIVLNDAFQRERALALQHHLDRSRSRQAETQARLNTVQAQLLQSAKLAAVGELAASVAHEINNPLYAARNSLYLIDRKLPPESSARQFLEIAQTELGRIAHIISRMRDFYRPTRAELAPTDLNQLLEETLALVSTHLRHGKVEVVATLDRSAPPVVVSADQLRQVFLNILLNACDAMSEGGTLHVGTGLGPLALATEGDDTGIGNGFVVVIRDSGSGIPAEVLPHLFEPFYTTKPQGTGLGLAISAHIVAQHGGHIGVDTELGVGSTFTITLPLEQRHEAGVDADVAPFLLHQLDQDAP